MAWTSPYDNEPNWSLPYPISPTPGSPVGENPEELFEDLTRRLRVRFRFDRAVLILRSESEQHLLAVASHGGREGNRRLRLTLPTQNSLIAKVAEGGFPYTESYCGFFSGNDLERGLLFDDRARAFAILPIKHDARVVGVLGFSAKDPEAFRLFEETDWPRLISPLSASIANQR